MKPIVKWSGGKSKEIKLFKEYYPKDFSRFKEVHKRFSLIKAYII